MWARCSTARRLTPVRPPRPPRSPTGATSSLYSTSRPGTRRPAAAHSRSLPWLQLWRFRFCSLFYIGDLITNSFILIAYHILHKTRKTVVISLNSMQFKALSSRSSLRRTVHCTLTKCSNYSYEVVSRPVILHIVIFRLWISLIEFCYYFWINRKMQILYFSGLGTEIKMNIDINFSINEIHVLNIDINFDISKFRFGISILISVYRNSGLEYRY